MEDGGDHNLPGEAKDYAVNVEDAFLTERGTPFTLVPKDWRQIEEWYKDGVPLETVIRGIQKAFKKHRARGAEGKISTILYCASAVEELWAFERRGLVGKTMPAAETPVVPGSEKFEHLISMLRERTQAPPGWLNAEDWEKALGKAIKKISELDRNLEFSQLEESLMTIEGALIRSLQKRMAAECEEDVSRRVADALGDSAKLRTATAEKLRKALTHREIRRAGSLPPLTLLDV